MFILRFVEIVVLFKGTDKKDGPQETESNIVFVAKRLAAQIKRIPSAKVIFLRDIDIQSRLSLID